MKSLLSIVLVVATAFALSACSNYSKRNYTEVPLNDGEEIVPFNEFCYFETEPQGAAFKIVKKKTVVAGNVYGSPDALLPKLEEKVKTQGGNSIANFNASQRFGFWPWRAIRPIVSGDAIQIMNAHGKSCAELGGHTR